MQRALDLLYPAQCITCDARVSTGGALCPSCWGDTPFIRGLSCDLCGTPLPGEEAGAIRCDDCRVIARPWSAGRSVMAYAGNARRLILSFKHGNRVDLAKPAGDWMAAAAAALIGPDTLTVPVPLHWSRLIKRRYNQSALLAQRIAQRSDATCAPDLLTRTRRTASQDGRTPEGRFDNIDAAITAHPRRSDIAKGRNILLVDDVMTSGATLAACALVCRGVGAARVDVVTLARVAKDA